MDYSDTKMPMTPTDLRLLEGHHRTYGKTQRTQYQYAISDKILIATQTLYTSIDLINPAP